MKIFSLNTVSRLLQQPQDCSSLGVSFFHDMLMRIVLAGLGQYALNYAKIDLTPAL